MIVITGGCGFIGSALIWGLNRRDIENILVVDLFQTDDRWKNLLNLRFKDLISKDAFIEKLERGALKKVDGILHMGACSNTLERDTDYLLENNFHYTKRLALWCIKNDVRLVYASSAATYGDGSAGFSDEHKLLHQLKPLNAYAFSKHIFDLWAYENAYLGKIVGVKFFNVFGPNEYHKGEMRSMVLKAYQQIEETGSFRLFKSYRNDYKDGAQMRDFIYVKDAVDMVLHLYDDRHLNGIYNIGTGRARSYIDMARAVADAMGKELKIEFIEMPDDVKDRYQYFTQADIKKLRDAGYTKKTIELEDAIDDYVKNYLMTDDAYLGRSEDNQT
ncbi:MAG TPA: ADP-glyceromanno-heptose 6-epimerase [Firmicutes bacterium]|nr:ADP-glyceromanno-heptose 6-epimerase [Bacillota bacterium]